MSTSSRPKTAILAIDQGTHASRALLFSGEGRVLFVHHCKIGMTRRGPHRVEQDPEEIISSLQEVIRKARDTHPRTSSISAALE